MIGFSVYVYEGIGVVMPIMATCNCPDKFPKLLIAAVAFLTFVYIVFAEICYYTFGEHLTAPIVMSMMPESNIIIMIVKILYCLNLTLGYPLCIYPTNVILESYVFKSLKKDSALKNNLKNISRSMVVAAAVVLAVVLAEKLDKFLSILGALLCAPIAFTVPALCHFVVLAKTPKEKLIDISIIAISFVLLVVCTIQGIESWNTDTSHLERNHA